MMKIGLIDVDSKHANLALMKISAYHKKIGDSVEWFDPLFSKCDIVYASKVFTFTKDYGYYPNGTIKGGTGFRDYTSTVPDELICPDYSLYNLDYSMGFLTRGCPNHCEWCVVPEKEGNIRPAQDIEEFARHRDVVLLDNNVLSSDFGIKQIEKIARLKLKVDFNQGLDARLIDKPMAKLLAKVKWLKPIRLASDNQAQKIPVERAVNNLREAGATPSRYFCYLLVKDVAEAHDRSEHLRLINVDPFAQPYRDFRPKAKPPTRLQKGFARWVNHKANWKTETWQHYKNREHLKEHKNGNK